MPATPKNTLLPPDDLKRNLSLAQTAKNPHIGLVGGTYRTELRKDA